MIFLRVYVRVQYMYEHCYHFSDVLHWTTKILRLKSKIQHLKKKFYVSNDLRFANILH